MTSDRVFVGIDLGGTEIKAAALTEHGEVLEHRSIGTRGREGRDAVMERLAGIVDWARQVSPDGLAGAGVAIPGVLDMQSGRVEMMTNLTHDWNGFLLKDALQDRTGMKTSVMNDVRAATLGEQVWGAGKPYSDFICIAIGTGIGGGLVLTNDLYMGARGAAGEIGHITVLTEGGYLCNCGNHGCLETIAAAPALTRAAREAIEAGDDLLGSLAGSIEPAPHQIVQAAQRGSETANRIFSYAGRMTGQALAGLVMTLNPQAIVVGGGVAKAGELLLEPIRREIKRRTTLLSPERGGVEVLQSPLGGEAGAIGAAAWAMRSDKGAA
ncbi:MAG TPA: hypothetical protein DEV93_16985 [Chloroflexi bacterium]|nr:hypothetical protein [Chloroflexota bacterium]